MSQRKITVAQIRGNGLSDRETKTWEYFSDDIVQTVFQTTKNVYAQSALPFPMKTVRSSADNFFTKNLFKYYGGQYQRMFGLEPLLAGFDIAHVGEIYNYYTYQAVIAKHRFPNLKVVATVWENSFGRFEYNYWPGFKMPPRYWRKKMQEIIATNARGVDMFLPVSQDAAELLSDFGVADARIKVVVPGIIRAPQVSSTDIPSQLAGKEIYLMVNRLVKEKGVYDVLYGWRRYLARIKNTERKILVIVGSGPERDNMLRLVQEWGFTDRIFFINQVPYHQVLNLYKQAKCLILDSIPMPTWQEQFGYVLAEAICAGTPIVSTYCGAIPEVVGAAGLLVTPAHPIALAEALVHLDDPTTYARLKAGCETEKKKFAVELYVQQVADVYRSLASSV
jgi:glycosyltransferase involved in cell wall biosynthesis